MDSKIFNTLQRVQSEKDEGRRSELMAATNEDLAQHFMRTPGDLEELAFDLFNQAWADAVDDSVLSRIIEVKTVGLGDTDWIEEDLRGMRAIWQGKGGQIRSDIIRYERTNMPREEMVTAIDLHQDEVATDFWGTLGKLSSHASEKLRLLPVTRLIELIQSGIGGAYYGQFAASTLTAAQVDSILNAVSIKVGGNVTIVGTQHAVRKLSVVGLEFGDFVKNDVFQTGQIGVYKGYPVVQVANEAEDFDGAFVLPNDELWLVGRNAGRLTYYGSTPKVQQLRLPSFYFRWETARDAGMLLYGASKGRIGRIKLT